MSVLNLALLVASLAQQRPTGVRAGLGGRALEAMGLARVRLHRQVNRGTGIAQRHLNTGRE